MAGRVTRTTTVRAVHGLRMNGKSAMGLWIISDNNISLHVH